MMVFHFFSFLNQERIDNEMPATRLMMAIEMRRLELTMANIEKRKAVMIALTMVSTGIYNAKYEARPPVRCSSHDLMNRFSLADNTETNFDL